MEDRWLTYQQAGDLLGVSAEAIRRHARRHNWRVQRGNDGKALVLVPAAAATEGWARPPGRPDGARVGSPGGQDPGRPPGQPGDMATVADMMTALVADRRAAETDAAQARREADELRREVSEARERAARVEGELAGVRVAFEQAQGRAERAEAEALASQDAVARGLAQAAAERVAREAAEATATTERQARIAAKAREAEASALTQQIVGQLDAMHRERVEAQTRVINIQYHLDRAEAERDSARTEAAVLRDAEARAAAQVTVDRTARQAAEVERNAVQAKLAELTAGGPLRRALRAFVFRRGRS
ncbi:MAG: hypothetical protein ACJ8H8_33680 [Geminicoccaceae bacterium]